jgi:hypothetical protein
MISETFDNVLYGSASVLELNLLIARATIFAVYNCYTVGQLFLLKVTGSHEIGWQYSQ